MNGRNPKHQFESVKDFVEQNGLRKGFVASKWGISNFQMTALIYPGRYRFSLTDEQWTRIAKELNQRPDDLRKSYAAAA